MSDAKVQARAKQRGMVAGIIVNEGDTFEIEKHLFTDRWMELVEAPAARPKRVAKAEVPDAPAQEAGPDAGAEPQGDINDA